MKSFLFVMQMPSYSSIKGQEVLDVVLITAAFDQKVSVLLLDDAVFHLKKNQQGRLLANKDISGVYRSLELYDVEALYVEQESLTERGLSADDLLLPIQLICRAEIATVCSAFDFVLNG